MIICTHVEIFVDIGNMLYRNKTMFKIAKGYDSVTKTIRIPEPLAQELETLATQNNISLNQLINQCVVFALEHQEKQDTTENTANSKEK